MAKKLNINEDQAQCIIDQYLQGSNYKTLSQEFGVSKETIRKTIVGLLFPDCDRPNNLNEIMKERFISSRVGGRRIDQEIAQKIIDEYCLGASTYELEDKYNLWQTSICNLISGRTWPQCNRPENISEMILQRHEKGLFKEGHFDEIHQSYPLLTDKQKEIIAGSMLGDGHFHKIIRNNSYFTKQQCVKYKEYIEWHYEQFLPYSKPTAEIFSKEKIIWNKETSTIERISDVKKLCGYVFKTCLHPCFTELRNYWYPHGKKIIPNDLVLTPLSIAIWFCDDGCNSYNNREAVIATQSFSMDEAYFLLDLLKEFEIKGRVVTKISPRTGVHQPILKMNSTSYDNLIHLIKPYVPWACMKHKIKWRKALKQWEYSNKLSENDVLNVYEMIKTHKRKEIAKFYDVHEHTISSILRGESWKHLFDKCTYINKRRIKS